uniref:Uncharacterized protein n=1 Tax=Acrobeloides nanus TaxID=290746 RepID=A0A914DR80_9BILA
MFDMIGYDENLAGIPTLHDIYMIKDGSKFYYHVFSRANADSLQKETLARLEDLANPCHRSSLARIELHSSFSLVSICSNDLSNITVDEKLRLQAVKLYQRRKQSTRKNFNNSLCLDEIEFTGKTYQYKHTLDDATMYFNEYINKTVYNNPDEFLLSVLYPITTCSISCKDGEQELYKIPGCKSEIF